MGGFTITKRVEGKTFAITRKIKTRSEPVAKNDLRAMRFNGEVVDRPIRFPDDVAQMRFTLKGMGIALGDLDCQALYNRLSVDHYPLPGEPGPDAWLVYGILHGLVRVHALDYLVDA